MIEVGEYIRFKNGKIRKAIGRDIDRHLLVDIYIYGSNWLTFNEEADILKHSKNIIDLIEDTDILQVEISEEWVEKENAIKFIIVGQTYTINEIKEALENGMYKIQQILTKEQYNQNCYRLEETC